MCTSKCNRASAESKCSREMPIPSGEKGVDKVRDKVGDKDHHTQSSDAPLRGDLDNIRIVLVGTLYEQRESQGDRQFYKNPTFENLLNPYRVHS